MRGDEWGDIDCGGARSGHGTAGSVDRRQRRGRARTTSEQRRAAVSVRSISTGSSSGAVSITAGGSAGRDSITGAGIGAVGTTGPAAGAGVTTTGSRRGLPGRTADSASVSRAAIGDFGFPTISGTPTLTESGTSRE